MRPTGRDDTVLVVLRGNSGSGKTTIAHALRHRYGRGLAIVSQDVLRRGVLQERDRDGLSSIGLIETTVRYALDHGFDVVLEGILLARRYGAMITRLTGDHVGQTHCFYLDVPVEEVLRRHATRAMAAEVTAEQVRGWHEGTDVVPGLGELVIGARSSLGRSVATIGTVAGWWGADDDLDLLRTETRVLWGADSLGAQPPPAGVVLCAGAGVELMVPPGGGPADFADRTFEGGPSYLVTPPEQVPPGVITSAGGAVHLSPAPGWADDEWDETFVSCSVGWALVHDGKEVLALCYSSRDSPAGVEAGLWTHPDHRRRGLGAAVTAGWASVVAGRDRPPAFYSTSADNLASQAVAASLGYRPIGWMWKITTHDP